MTDHVRTTYRTHRRATWGLALVLVGAILAVVAIPLASADDNGSRSYTMLFPSTGAVMPALRSTGNSATQQNLCTSSTYTSVQLELKNTSTSTSTKLGSAKVTFPNLVTLTGAKFESGQPAAATISRTGNLVTMKNLSLAKNAVVKFSVALTTGTAVAGPSSITARVPASGDDDDDGFKNPTFPKLRLYTCTTVSGRVYLDNNGNGSFDPSGTPADAGQNGWSMSLYNTSTPGQAGGPVTSGPSPDGTYAFTGVPTGSNYKVCVTPPASSGTWGQTAPSGTDCSSVSGALAAGRMITNLQSPATDQDFGLEKTIQGAAPGALCDSDFGPQVIAGSQIVEYMAQLTKPSDALDCKPAVVMYSYLDGSQPYAVIRPTSTAGASKNWVVERIRMKVPGDAQNPVTLKYDDTKPYGDVYTTMRMCKSDPRTPNEDFDLAQDPANVMPDGSTQYGGPETTCMIKGTDLPSGDPFNYEAYLATDVDGIKTPS